MNTSSEPTPTRKRRRRSQEFKSQVVAQCLEPGVSVSRIALDNDLNANLVRRWINQARQVGTAPSTPPAFRTSHITDGGGSRFSFAG